MTGGIQNAVLVDGGKRLCVFLPIRQKRRTRTKDIILPHGLDPLASFGKNEHETLCLNLARAFRWKQLLDEGTFGSVNDLAKHGGVDRAYIGRLLRLTLLAPDIVEAILEGREPDGVTLPDLLQSLPWLWEEQRGVLYQAMCLTRQPEVPPLIGVNQNYHFFSQRGETHAGRNGAGNNS